MEHDDIPSGTSPTLPATRSVTDLLRAHRATSKWKIVSSTHLLASVTTLGAPYAPIISCIWCGKAMPANLVHGPQASGMLSTRPGWKKMACIREAAQEPLQAELSEAHQIIDRQHDDLAAAKSDYNRLGDKLNEEIAYR